MTKKHAPRTLREKLDPQRSLGTDLGAQLQTGVIIHVIGGAQGRELVAHFCQALLRAVRRSIVEMDDLPRAYNTVLAGPLSRQEPSER